MKKILLFTVASFVVFASFAQQQIGNGDMEQWANNDEPDNWNSFLTAAGTWSGFAGDQCESSTDVRPGTSGTKSCRIFAAQVLTAVANGNVTLGRINMGSTTPSNSANHNFSVTSDPNFSETLTDAPDSIVFWAKFTPNGGAWNARMKATIHDSYDYTDPETGASASHIVATAVKNFPTTNGSWKRFSIPFDYSGPASVSEYILITFATNETPGVGAANDEVLIDDVELIYNPEVTIGELSNDGIIVSMNNNSNTIVVDASFELNGIYNIYNTHGQSVQAGDVSKNISFDQVPGVYFVHINEINRTYKFEIIKN